MNLELKKQNLFILLFIIILLFCTNKISFYNNLINLIKFNEEQRITNFYGYCHDESIGYLKYLKKRYKFDNNPEIINFRHTPQTNWSIFDSRKLHNKSNEKIFLNYPGNELNVALEVSKNSNYEFKDIYYYSTISSKIQSLILPNNNNNKYFFLDFYLKNKSNKLKKIKSIKIYNYLNNNEYLIDLSFDEFKLDEKKIFIKITDPNSNIYLQEDVKIKLINRYNLENYKIINNFKNCYYLKN